MIRAAFAVALLAAAGAAPVGAQQDERATLPEVEVGATRIERPPSRTPASLDVVDGAALREARPGAAVADGLGAVPGLVVRDRQNLAQDLQLSIRGFGARSAFGIRGVRIYVDDIPATMPDGQGQVSHVEVDGLERVEVLRGPYSALYGNSGGGVIRFFTQEGEGRPTLMSSFSAGSHGTWRTGLGLSGSTRSPGAAGNVSYALNLSQLDTDGYRDHSRASRNTTNARLVWNPDADSRAVFVWNGVEIDAQDPLGLSHAQFQADPRSVDPLAIQYDTRKTVRQSQVGLRYERHLGAGNELGLMAYAGERETVQYQAIPAAAQTAPGSSGGVVDLRRNYAGADLRWTHRNTLLGQPLSLVVGLAVDTLGEDRKGYRNFTGAGAARTFGVHGELRRDERNRAGNFDQYLQASWSPVPRWSMDLGLRHSHVMLSSTDHFVVPGNGDDGGRTSYDRWLPVVAIRHELSPALSVHASAGRGFETPTLNELSYQPDGTSGFNLALRPSTTRNVELGVRQRVRHGVFTAAVFQVQGSDELVTASSSGGRTTYRNAADTRRRGLELGWTGLHGNWTSQLAYTLLDARYTEGFCSPVLTPGSGNPGCVAGGNRIPGIARNALYLAAGWKPLTGWRAGLEGRWLSAVPVNDANTSPASGWFVASLLSGYRWAAGSWTLQASGRLDNVFDRRYAGSVIVNEASQRYLEPAPGRNWSAGVSATVSF